MADLAIIETGNGGDAILSSSDLLAVFGYENMPYLSMFGGGGPQGEAWWGNDLLMTGDVTTRFESQTEKVVSEVALNSAGRLKIEAAIMADLGHIKKNVPDTKIDVSTTIAAVDRLDIRIDINGQQFYYQWNPGSAFLNYKV